MMAQNFDNLCIITQQSYLDSINGKAPIHIKEGSTSRIKLKPVITRNVGIRHDFNTNRQPQHMVLQSFSLQPKDEIERKQNNAGSQFMKKVAQKQSRNQVISNREKVYFTQVRQKQPLVDKSIACQSPFSPNLEALSAIGVGTPTPKSNQTPQDESYVMQQQQPQIIRAKISMSKGQRTTTQASEKPDSAPRGVRVPPIYEQLKLQEIELIKQRIGLGRGEERSKFREFVLASKAHAEQLEQNQQSKQLKGSKSLTVLVSKRHNSLIQQRESAKFQSDQRFQEALEKLTSKLNNDHKLGTTATFKDSENDEPPFTNPLIKQRQKRSKRKKLLEYQRRVPHAVHDAQGLSNIMSQYIDKNKVTNHTFLSKLEEPLPSSLVNEYQSVLSFNKDVVNAVLKQQSLELLKRSQSTGALNQQMPSSRPMSILTDRKQVVSSLDGARQQQSYSINSESAEIQPEYICKRSKLLLERVIQERAERRVERKNLRNQQKSQNIDDAPITPWTQRKSLMEDFAKLKKRMKSFEKFKKYKLLNQDL